MLIQNYADSGRISLLRGEREAVARNAAKCFYYSSLSSGTGGNARTKANVYGVFVSCTSRRRGEEKPKDWLDTSQTFIRLRSFLFRCRQWRRLVASPLSDFGFLFRRGKTLPRTSFGFRADCLKKEVKRFEKGNELSRRIFVTPWMETMKDVDIMRALASSKVSPAIFTKFYRVIERSNKRDKYVFLTAVIRV